jgi:membrane-bound ClpP family serine protease
MSAKKRERALPDRCERREKIFVEGEYWSASSHRLVKKGQPVQIIGLTTKVKPET